jgi:putative ABC transport system permease protein
MRYFPLIWAALRRKPIRTFVTFLSVTVAFTLFGLMIGLSATFDLVAEKARADRIYSDPRFGGNNGMPVAVARQIASLPGVKTVAVLSYIGGYVQDPKNRAFVAMLDGQAGHVLADWGITQPQWDAAQRDRTGVVMSRSQAERWHKKVGDTFTIITPQSPRADGGKSWNFKVLAIAEDIPQAMGGYIIGNYDYFDKARPLADQGKINEVALLANDPGRSAELVRLIDQTFANSATPLASITDKMARGSGDFGGLNVKTVTRDIALAGMFMVLFLTANGIAQSVRERFAEFATLKTIGFSDRAVMIMVVLEAALPCVLGAALGVALAALLARQIPALMPPGFGLPLPTMTGTVFLWAAISAFGVALASSVLPVLRLRQMDIATALSGRT